MSEFTLATTNEANPVALEDDNRFIMELTAPRTVSYCSFEAKTEAEKIRLYNATNNPENRLKEWVNKSINVKDVFVEVVQCTNEETGEVRACPRIVLIDTKGKSYTAVSVGVFSSIKKIFGIFGTPDMWGDKGITVTPKLVDKGKYNVLTLNI